MTVQQSAKLMMDAFSGNATGPGIRSPTAAWSRTLRNASHSKLHFLPPTNALDDKTSLATEPLTTRQPAASVMRWVYPPASSWLELGQPDMLAAQALARPITTASYRRRGSKCRFSGERWRIAAPQLTNRKAAMDVVTY